MTPTRHRVNPAVYAALDKLGPMPVPFFVPDVEGEWVMHSETDAAKPQGERMSRDMRAKARELERTLPYTPGESAACARIDMIEQVLVAILPPPGHILDSEGVVRKEDDSPNVLDMLSDMGHAGMVEVARKRLAERARRFAAAAAATAGGEGEFKLCDECGVNPGDPNTCAGCDAYREHQA
jgi:hypothetical protein